MYTCYQTCLPHLCCTPWPLTQPWTISPQVLVVFCTCGDLDLQWKTPQVLPMWLLSVTWKNTLDTMYTCYRTCLPHLCCAPWPLTQYHYKYLWCFGLVVFFTTNITTCGEKHHMYFSQCLCWYSSFFSSCGLCDFSSPFVRSRTQMNLMGNALTWLHADGASPSI